MFPIVPLFLSLVPSFRESLMFNIVCKMRSQLHLVDVNKDKEISQSHLNQNGTVQNLIVNNLKAETCFTLLLDNPRIADRFLHYFR